MVFGLWVAGGGACMHAAVAPAWYKQRQVHAGVWFG